VKLLVDGGSLSPAGRMGLAASGLALRGHEVLWHGPGIGDGAGRAPRPAPAGIRLARERADLVLGGGAHPARTALAGWLGGAHGMVLGLEGSVGRDWRALDRWAWSTLYSSGLVEESDAEAARTRLHGLGLDRLALWSSEPPPAVPDATHLDTEILERACERALARHRGRVSRPAVFADRDGTLVVERGYLSDPDDLELLPGVPQALRNLRAQGFALVLVSNQSGVGRGLFPLSRVYQAMARLRRLLRARGVELDAVYFCPHRPEAGCACRKPAPGLLERAAEDLVLDLSRSVMIGDKLIDVETGHRAGAGGVLVRSGYGRDEERRLAGEGVPRPPDRVCEDFAEAARWLIEGA